MTRESVLLPAPHPPPALEPGPRPAVCAPGQAGRGRHLAGCCRGHMSTTAKATAPHSPFLRRLVGAQGVVGRWYTAVLRPETTASMVSSSREDVRYCGMR